MTTATYLFQAILYLLAIAAIPVVLTKRPLSRRLRLVVALCPIVLGLFFYLLARQTSGVFVALMGLWTLFFVTIHPRQSQDERKEDEA